jgi:hypothetical protein
VLTLAQEQYATAQDIEGGFFDEVESGAFDFIGTANFGFLDNSDYLLPGPIFIATPGRLLVQIRIWFEGTASQGMANWSFAAPLSINIPYIVLLLYDLP